MTPAEQAYSGVKWVCSNPQAEFGCWYRLLWSNRHHFV